jgi:hypothetical protein
LSLTGRLSFYHTLIVIRANPLVFSTILLYSVELEGNGSTQAIE